MRCPDCGIFVSFDDDDSNAEVGSDVEVDEETGELDYSGLEVRFPRLCSECSRELTEYNFSDFTPTNDGDYDTWREDRMRPWLDVEQEIEDLREAPDMAEDLDAKMQELADLGERPTFEVETEDPSLNNWTRSTDRHGKPIRNPRYMRNMFQIEVDATVSCSDGESFTVHFASEPVQASSFEELG